MRSPWGALSAGFLTVFLCVAATRPLSAVDFIRGDANGDGVVSLADILAIAQYKYRAGRHDCRESLDYDGDGVITVGDQIQIAWFLMGSGPPPVAPYPDPGPDPALPSLPCSAYGGGAVIEDPEAEIAVRDAIAGGGSQRLAFINVALSHARPTFAMFGRISDPAGILDDDPAIADRISRSIVEFSGFLTTELGKLSGQSLSFTAVGLLDGSNHVPPSDGLLNLEIPVCLKAGTAAGTYPLVLEAGELVDFDTARSVRPALASATIQVVEDVAATDCAPAPGNHFAYRLGDAVASPGEEVVVPFFVRSSASLSVVEVSIDHDESVLDAVGIEQAWRRPDGQEFLVEISDVHSAEVQPGNDIATEGGVGAAIHITSFGAAPVFPRSEETRFFDIRFRIRADAAPGTVAIRFVDGVAMTDRHPSSETWCAADGSICSNATRYINQVRTNSGRFDPSTADSFLLIPSTLKIVGDVTIFRGDVNADRNVGLDDALVLLRHLFVGGEMVSCKDAADANDDGELDIADPVAILTEKFIRRGAIDPPYPLPGKDPTPDGLDCGRPFSI